jgi:hypothetical protein
MIKIERQREMATKILLGLVASSSCRNIVTQNCAAAEH